MKPAIGNSMTCMSASEKGNKFADKIFDRVAELAQAGGLPYSPSMCKPRREHGYPSYRRGGLIKLDVTIEVWPQNSDRWAFLWAFECKDHADRIGVEYLETFYSRLNDVAPCNNKGIMVSTSAFTREALTYAERTGMGLIRILPDDQVDYVMYGKVSTHLPGIDHSSQSVNEPFLIDEYRGQNQRFFAMYGDKRLPSLSDVFEEMSKPT